MSSAPVSQDPPPAGQRAFRIGGVEIVELRGVEVSGLSMDPGGREATCSIARIAVERMAARFGAVNFTAEGVSMRNVTARFADSRLHPSTLLACRVQRLELARLAAAIGPVPVGAERAPVQMPVRLEALRGAHGLLHTFATDALWNIDVEAIVPVANGAIELARIDLNHIGPDSRVGVGPGGIRIIPPAGAPIDALKFNGAEVDVSKGVLDLSALIAHMLRSTSGQPVASVDERIKSALQRVRLDGDMQLGPGALGDATRYMVLGSDGADANRLEIASSALGQGVAVRIPRLLASTTHAALQGFQLGTAETVASVEARAAFKQDATGEASGGMAFDLTVSALTCRDISLDPAGTG